MQRGVANTIITCVAFMALLVGLSVNRILHPPGMSRDQLNENGLFVYDVPRNIGEFTLTSHHGETFSLDKLKGQWTLVFFGYTYCPDICPTTMATLAAVTDMLAETDYAEDTRVVMVSVDPQRDTPEQLATYVSYFNPDFTGVTGEYIEIFNLGRQLNIAFSYLPGKEEGLYEVTHSGEIPLINPNGHFQGFFKYPPDPQKIFATYTSLRRSSPAL